MLDSNVSLCYATGNHIVNLRERRTQCPTNIKTLLSKTDGGVLLDVLLFRFYFMGALNDLKMDKFSELGEK